MTKPMYNPGSADAVGRGCTCDLIKNDFGRGKAEPDGVAFYCAETCPVHGVLLTITSPQTDVGVLSDETKAALKWLKSRVARPFKRRS
jgi:hypothetical protein